MKQEDLKRMIMEELGKLREARNFAGLEVSALDGAGEEVIRMTWRREPSAPVAEQTLLAQLELSTVKRLMVHKGEEWIEANLPTLADDVRVDYPEEEPRFSPEQEEQDARLENPDLYYGDDDMLQEGFPGAELVTQFISFIQSNPEVAVAAITANAASLAVVEVLESITDKVRAALAAKEAR